MCEAMRGSMRMEVFLDFAHGRGNCLQSWIMILHSIPRVCAWHRRVRGTLHHSTLDFRHDPMPTLWDVPIWNISNRKPFSIQFISWSTELSHEHSIVGPYSMTILQSLVFRLSKNQKRLVHTGVWTVVLLHHSTQGFRTPSHYAHHSISMCSRVHVRHHLKPLRTALVVHLGESCETPEVCSCVAEASLSRSPLEGSTDLGIVYGSWFATFFSSPLHPIPFLNGIWCLPAHSLCKRNPAFAGCLMLKEPSVTIFRSICTVPRNGHIH